MAQKNQLSEEKATGEGVVASYKIRRKANKVKLMIKVSITNKKSNTITPVIPF